jgi:hypothetical protein
VTLRFVAVGFETPDPRELGAFWSALLGREVIEEDRGVLLPGDETQIGLRFTQGAAGESGRSRLHLHLTSANTEDQRHTVETVLGLGGRRFGTKPLPLGRDSVYLADPSGYEFCVIEPGNNYLAGTGRLGEFTCEGTREVGLFWSEALGWPLVWDRGDQTAIQSPRGGTKISWDAWSDDPTSGSHRQQFHLAAPEPVVEADRLVALGATVRGERDDGLDLSDPDGNPFSIDFSES